MFFSLREVIASAIVFFVIVLVWELPTAGSLEGYWRSSKGYLVKIEKIGFRTIKVTTNGKTEIGEIYGLNNIKVADYRGYCINRSIIWKNHESWTKQNIEKKMNFS